MTELEFRVFRIDSRLNDREQDLKDLLVIMMIAGAFSVIGFAGYKAYKTQESTPQQVFEQKEESKPDLIVRELPISPVVKKLTIMDLMQENKEVATVAKNPVAPQKKSVEKKPVFYRKIVEKVKPVKRKPRAPLVDYAPSEDLSSIEKEQYVNPIQVDKKPVSTLPEGITEIGKSKSGNSKLVMDKDGNLGVTE